MFPFPFRVVWSRSVQKCSIQSRWNMVLCLTCLLNDQPFSVLLFSQEDTYMWHILRWMILLPSILKLSRMLMIRFYLTFFFFNVAILCNLFGLDCLLQYGDKFLQKCMYLFLLVPTRYLRTLTCPISHFFG